MRLPGADFGAATFAIERRNSTVPQHASVQVLRMALYSIGTSNRSWDAFLEPLRRLDIRTLFDVRSRPYSRFAHFNRPRMEAALPLAGISYRWMGESLGGLEEVDHSGAEFLKSLACIVTEGETVNAAYCCAEGDAANCHRAWTVGAEILRQHQINTLNILRDDSLEQLEVTLARVRTK